MSKYVDFRRVKEGRMLRSKDRKLKSDLQLKYLGLMYVRNDWRADPRQFYFSVLNRKLYVKMALNNYVVLTTLVNPGMTLDEISTMETSCVERLIPG